MFDLRKLWGRDHRRAGESDTGLDASLPRGKGLEAEYESLIASQCRRWGIGEGTLTIEVRQVGQGPDGKDVYLGMLRLARWDRNAALRMLLGLPLLETKIRRMVRSLWLSEVSHFGGLWLHASEQLQHASEGMGELRQLIRQLAPPAGVAVAGGPPGSFEESSLHGASSLTASSQGAE